MRVADWLRNSSIHGVLAFAFVAEILVTSFSGYLVARDEFVEFPLSAPAMTDIVDDSNSNQAEHIHAAALNNDVILALKTYENTANGTQVVLQTQSTNLKQLPLQPGEVSTFGYGYQVRAEALDVSNVGVGRWAVFGDQQDIHTFTQEVENLGFSLTTKYRGIDYKLDLYSREPQLIIAAASGLFAVFVAGLVSASRSMAIRSVRELLGWSRVRTVTSETLELGCLALILIGVASLAWITVASFAWGIDNALLGAGSTVIEYIAAAGIGSAVVAGTALLSVTVAIPKIREQLAGRRPQRLLSIASACAFLVIAIAAVQSVLTVQSHQIIATATQQSREFWKQYPEAHAISIGWNSEAALQEQFANTSTFVDDVGERGNRATLSYVENGCSYNPGIACMTVNANYLTKVDVLDVNGSKLAFDPNENRVLLGIPASLETRAEEIAQATREWVNFQQEMRCAESLCSAQDNAIEIERTIIPSGKRLPAFNSSVLQSGDPPLDSVLTVVPNDLLSGDFLLSAISDGSLVFFADEASIREAARKNGIEYIVSSFDRP